MNRALIHDLATGRFVGQTASVPSGRLVAHSFEQLADVDPVIRQRAFAGPALLLHPSAGELGIHHRQVLRMDECLIGSKSSRRRVTDSSRTPPVRCDARAQSVH
jgi:hypothetical protein